MLDNHEDFDRVAMGLWVKVRAEPICWDLWSSKPKTMSMNHLHLMFPKNTPHMKHRYTQNKPELIKYAKKY